MRGKVLIIHADSITNDEFIEKNQSFLNAAKHRNIQLEMKSNIEVYTFIDNNNVKCHDSFSTFDYVLFFDQDINLAKNLEMLGVKVINSARALGLCENKANMYQELARNKINIPKTVILPTLDSYTRSKVKNYLEEAIGDLGLPLIIKEWFGDSGKNVYLTKTKEEAYDVIEKLQCKQLLLQEYIMESNGCDIRMFVIKDKVVASMRRQSVTGDFRSNLALGGILQKYAPSYQDEMLAVSASKAMGCDFSVVDVLKSINGPVVCEVNTTANVNNFNQINNCDIADLLFKSIK